MPTLQTVSNEGASTQIFGGRRYETLPMQDCKQSTTEEKLQLPNTGEREEGILHRMRVTVQRRMHPHTSGEKSQNMSCIVTAAEYTTYLCTFDTLNIRNNCTSTHPQ